MRGIPPFGRLFVVCLLLSIFFSNGLSEFAKVNKRKRKKRWKMGNG